MSRSLKWNCKADGCFNIKKRLNFDALRPVGFPGWTDIDGYSERRGNKIFIEWKPSLLDLDNGQEIAFRSLTEYSEDVVIQICGDAETMSVEAVKMCFRGRWGDWQPYTTNKLNDLFLRWNSWASEHPRARL